MKRFWYNTIMQKHSLKVSKREVFGKNLKKLRREDILPANVYGKDVKSQAVQLPLKDFKETYEKTGETGLVELSVDGTVVPVLIHNVQLDYVKHTPLHADFFQVNLKEKVKTMVPVVIVNEPKAVTEKIGLLLQPLTEVEVEALPTDLPEKLEVNVENLAEVGQSMKVGDITKPSGVDILTDPEQVIANIGALVTQEALEEAKEEAAAAEEAKAEGTEGEEGNAEEVKEEAQEAKEAAAEAPKEESK